MKVVHYFYFPLNVGMWMGACLGAEGPRIDGSLVETIDPGLVAVGLGWSSIYWMRQNPGPGIVAVRLVEQARILSQTWYLPASCCRLRWGISGLILFQLVVD